MKKIHLNGRITIQPDQILIDGGSFGVASTPGGTILKVPGDLVYDGVIDGGSFDPPTPTPIPTPTNNGEGKRQQRRISTAEAEVRVRDWLYQYATRDPFGVSIRQVAAAVGVAVGTVAKTAAWRAFEDRRKAMRPPKAREVPLSDGMLSAFPDDRQAELDSLIAEQAADMRRDHRRS